MLAFPPRTHIWRAIRVDDEPEPMHRTDLRVKDFFMTADEAPSEGRPRSWSVFQRCTCTVGHCLSLERALSLDGSLQRYGGREALEMDLAYIRFLSNPEAPFNYLNISWGNRPREGGYLVGFIKLRAEPYINISFTVISRY